MPRVYRCPARCLRSAIATALLAACMVSAGCPRSQPSATAPAALPLVGVDLRVLVAGDPSMAREIERLKAEWKARTGGTFEVEQITEEDLVQSAEFPADVVVYPASRIGALIERDKLAPLPASVLESKELDWHDVFELIQLDEATWGQTPYAVPFGSPVFTCLYRRDLLEQLNRDPPRTWSEYQELAAVLNLQRLPNGTAKRPAEWAGVGEPLGPGWRGRVLLARAAAYAKHRDNYSTLFNIETMEPLIAGPAFVRALEELVAASKLGPPAALDLDPVAVRRMFFSGQCGLALTWPAAGDSSQQQSEMAVGFEEMPGATKVYSSGAQRWEDRRPDESPHVTLLAIAGRLGSVSAKCRQPAAAAALLAWLSGPEWGSRVGSVSPWTTLYRRSQLRTAQDWTGAAVDRQAARQYGRTVQQALSRTSFVFALRIPGEDEYFFALDDAVASAVRGEKSPSAALEEAAAKWRKTTDARGVASQRRAYQRSLGLEP